MSHDAAMYAWICTGDSDCTDLAILLLVVLAAAAAAWAALFVVPALMAAPQLSPGARRPKLLWAAISLPVAGAAGYVAVQTDTGPLWPALWWAVLLIGWMVSRARTDVPD